MTDDVLDAKVSRLMRELVDASDEAFLREVRRLRHVGYGRMMQIIEREHYRAAVEDDLSPVSGVLVVTTCFGLLTRQQQDAFVAGYRADPLFRLHWTGKEDRDA